MSNVTLRPATKDDIEQMYHISILAHQQGYTDLIPSDHREEFNHRYSVNRETQARYENATMPFIESSDHQALLAVFEERIVGYATMRRSGNEVQLKSLFVHPESQGLGVGSTLFQAALEWMGSSEASLTVINANERAKHLYEKYGFRVVQKADKQFFGAEQVVMKRPADRSV